MKEKDIWLSQEELQHMLQGSLQWNDVATHVKTSSKGIRKLNETNLEKKSTPISSPNINPNTSPNPSASSTPNPTASYTPQELKPIGKEQSMEPEKYSKWLEGQPVIWLLGSVGLLTLSSWFYFVLFSK